MHYSFQGKNALVTGSSKGIGRSVAIELAKGARMSPSIAVPVAIMRKRWYARLNAWVNGHHLRMRRVGSSGRGIDGQAKVDAFGSLDLFVSNAPTAIASWS